jgi:osmoprotectant transport system ATP-binding protein
MIEFNNVVKEYPNGFRAVNNLNLQIPDGEITVLIGPSGCGKTTSMRMINRLIDITGGEILIDGQDNRDIAVEELRRKIGYAIQQIGLFPHMTVYENIAVVPRLLKWEENRIRKRVDVLLELVGLNPDIYRDSYPRQLSGGQQQRIGVARALGADPPIMLMDEPFGAIDPITREILQNEFLQIQERVGKTIVFVTHDIDEAIKMGDRIVLLREGQMVQFDTPDQILAYPRNRFVRDFVGADRQLKRLGLLRIRDIMEPNPPSVFLSDTLDKAKAEMKRLNVRSAFVVDEDTGVLKGWVHREDTAHSTSLIDAMNEAPWFEISVRENATARDALSAMVARGFRTTPVVTSKGVLRGSITLDDMQALILEDDARQEETQASSTEGTDAG